MRSLFAVHDRDIFIFQFPKPVLHVVICENGLSGRCRKPLPEGFIGVEKLKGFCYFTGRTGRNKDSVEF